LAPKIERVQNGVQLATGDLNVKVQFYSESIVRVVKWPAGGTPEKLSLSVIQKDIPKLDVRFAEDEAGVTLSSGQVKLTISKSDGSIQYLDSAGRVLLMEHGRQPLRPRTLRVKKKPTASSRTLR